MSIEKSSVVGNTAVNFGGGIHVETDSTLSVSSTTVENNTAGDDGGESATHFAAFMTRIYLFGTPHGEQVLES
jgi:predicted outer membrane repeat protein